MQPKTTGGEVNRKVWEMERVCWTLEGFSRMPWAPGKVDDGRWIEHEHVVRDVTDADQL